MFKKKVGRPSNKYKRKVRNLKILGVTSIIGVFGILLYGVSNYSLKLNASVNTDTLSISNESRNLTNKTCVEDVYSFKINSTSGEINSITYSPNNKKWYKLKNNITYDKNNKKEATVTIRKSYEHLYIKAKNSKGEKVFGPFYICRNAPAYISKNLEELKNSTCYSTSFSFQIYSPTGLKNVYYSIDGGKNYKTKLDSITTNMNKKEKYVNITVKKSYNNLKIKIKDTLNNYKEFGPFNIKIQKNCENTQDNNQTVPKNNVAKTINIEDDYVKCSYEQVIDYIIGENVDLSTCEHIIKYKDKSEEKYNLNDSNYLKKDPKPLISKLITNDNKMLDTTNLKVGSYTLKFYNDNKEVRNDSLNKTITVNKPYKDTATTVTNYSYSIDAKDSEIKSKFVGKKMAIPCENDKEVIRKITESMIYKIENIDPNFDNELVDKSIYPISDNKLLKRMYIYLAKEENGDIIYTNIFTLVETKKKTLNNATISNVADKEFNGKAYTPQPQIKINDTILQNNKDYKLTYENNVNEGKATIIITGIGNYIGVRKTTFNIVKSSNPVLDISNAKVLTIKNQTYTGKAIKPLPVVKYGNITLKENVDYKLSYKNNKNVGMATITINGIKQYSGFKTVNFNIVEKKVNNMKVSGIKKKECKSVGVKFTITAKSNIKNVLVSTDYSSLNDKGTWRNAKNCTKKGNKANCSIKQSNCNLYYKVSTVNNEYQIFGPYCAVKSGESCSIK